MNSYKIAAELPHDYPEIYELVRVAFETADHSDGDEHDYVNQLRESPDYIPQLALTAKAGDEIIGHIMLTRTLITRPQGIVDALLLSPICVSLAYRNKGVGLALIKASLEAAAEMGFAAVFLVGEPDYYSRAGFRPVAEFGITDLGDIPARYVQGIELTPGFLAGKGGTIQIC